MRLVTLYAEVDPAKCTGCKTCEQVCPTLSIDVVSKKAIVDFSTCSGCGGCEQRCPEHAIVLKKRDTPVKLYEDPSKVDRSKIEKICSGAKFNPSQIICYCTETRAEEVAAAIINGAKTPEEISRRTGIRTGCKVECIQPVLRLLRAAGIDPEKPKGWQWYGITPTVWDIPDEVKKKYSSRGFYFDDDEALLTSVSTAKEEGDA